MTMSKGSKPLKIVAVCGCGMGSSVILRMNAEKVLKELEFNAKVEVADATTAKGATHDADLILLSKELSGLFKDFDRPMIKLSSFVDRSELKNKLEEFMKAQNGGE